VALVHGHETWGTPRRNHALARCGGVTADRLSPSHTPDASLSDRLDVIDLEPLRLGGDHHELASAIDRASRSLGFFVVVGHGVPGRVRDAAFDAARRFFAQPRDEKLRVDIARSPHHRGYVALASEALEDGLPGDLKECFDVGGELPDDHPEVRAGTPLYGSNTWPDLPGFREDVEAYQFAALDAAHLVLRGMALALDLEEHHFTASMHDPLCNLRLLHYPPTDEAPPGPDQPGCGAHTDYGSVTLLATDDVAGLQVQGRDGRWRDVSVEAGQLVVNLGDMFARWTNDRYVSTPHRVISPRSRHRYSIPFFVNPNFHTPISCLPSCTGPDHPVRYPTVTAGDYLLSRFDATHAYRGRQD
jgi:isopenicillin N synthase-like dioxygenase